jgi:hypothetical protein
MVSSAMTAGAPDSYRILGITPDASDQELRSAYRRLVQQHHPDHNGGSTESARRFEEIQRAYSQIRERRAAGGASAPRGARPRGATPPRPGAGPAPGHDPDLDARMAALEFELREAQRARERELRDARLARERAAGAARAAAREAEARDAKARKPDAEKAEGERGRPSDEELGYIATDDSLSKILTDARSELSDRFSQAREHPIVQRVSDLIEGLDDLASQVDRHRPKDRRRDP